MAAVHPTPPPLHNPAPHPAQHPSQAPVRPSVQAQATAIVLQGQFKVTNIAGLRFVSGGQSGVTNSSGTFTYEQGADITFSIGGVTLGITTGKAIITPIDLIASGSADHIAVQNMVRFLLMLDSDAYA